MILRIVLVSLRNLLRQPFRTFLILQGVVWGTALGVFPPAVINGSLRQVESRATRLGTDRLILAQDHVEAGRRFDWALVQRLPADYPELKHAIGMTLVQSGAGLPVVATHADVFRAQGIELARGRFFGREDVRQARRVGVLVRHTVGAKPAREQLGERVVLPEAIEVEVVGISVPPAAESDLLDEMGYQRDHPMRKVVEIIKQEVGVFEDPDLSELMREDVLMVPHTLFPDAAPRWIELRANPASVLALRDRLQNRLSAEGYEPVIYTNAILPFLYGETIKTALELNRAVFVLCICVGTSVVCAIMVLSVLERQREIAIRRVEGARRWHIALQFVVETGTLCTVGALLGVPLGIVIAIIRCAIEPLESVTWTFPTLEAAVLVLVVSAVGLLGGVLPAWRAMRVDPVEMLRYE